MELTTDSGCSKISFYMKELKLPFMICWISIVRVVIWSRPVSTSVWMAAVGVETTNIVVWVAVGPDPCTPEFEAMAMICALVETLLRPMVETHPSWVTITGGGVVTSWLGRVSVHCTRNHQQYKTFFHSSMLI